MPAAAAQDAVPEDDDDEVDQEGAVDGVDVDAYAEPPFDGGCLVHCCCCCHCCGCGCCCHPFPGLPHQPETPLTLNIFMLPCLNWLSSAEESVRERQLMAAEAGPSDAAAAAAADDEGEEEQEFEELQEPPFPDPELRPMLLCDLLGRAAEEEVAAIAHNSKHPLMHRPATADHPLSAMSLPPTHITCTPVAWTHPTACVAAAAWCVFLAVCAAFPDLQIAGLSDDPASVMPGDIYCCIERITRSSVWNGHDPEAVAAALAAGAVAILAEAGTDFPDFLIPDSVPVIYADEVDELATRLAAVLHGECGAGRTLPVSCHARLHACRRLVEAAARPCS